MTANRRIFYACTAIGIAPYGSTTFTAIHGIQSAAVNTKFNLEQIFEIGQLNIYQNVEDLPDIEVTTEKCLDGYPLVGHWATYGAVDYTLLGRSNQRCMFGLSIFSDTQNAASGNAFQQVTCSGMYLSSWGFNVPIEGVATESVTLVGNNKTWATSGAAITFNGGFTGNDAPLAPEGINRRQNVDMVNSRWPLNIPGIDASGVNEVQSDGTMTCHIQGFRSSVNLGRDALLELGKKSPYFRYAQFPVEVRTDIDVLDVQGDLVVATEAGLDAYGNNLGSGDHIFLQMTEGTKLDLGVKNLLSSVNFSGANAGTRGGNARSTFSYISFNNFDCRHPQDPTPGLAG